MFVVFFVNDYGNFSDFYYTEKPNMFLDIAKTLCEELDIEQEFPVDMKDWDGLSDIEVASGRITAQSLFPFEGQ